MCLLDIWIFEYGEDRSLRDHLFHVKDSGQGLLVDLTSRFLGGKHDWSTLWIHY